MNHQKQNIPICFRLSIVVAYKSAGSSGGNDCASVHSRDKYMLCSRNTNSNRWCDIFLKQYGMSVYFDEVTKELNICFEDFV